MLKISGSFNVEIHVKFFNLILKSGIYPTLWRDNYIKPIVKGECFNNPLDYRGVAVSSCMGKFF